MTRSNWLSYAYTHNNYNVTSIYSSNTRTNNNHHSHTSLKTHVNMICAYIRHIYACGTISPTTRSQPNILCKSTPPLTIQLCKSKPTFTFLIWLNMIYDAWTYKHNPNNAKHSTYTSTNNIVKVHLHLHWSTSTTIALSSIYVHTINNSQFK